MTKILTAVVIAGAALAAAATAAAPVTVSLAASATVVDYGKPVTLSGTLSTQKANQAIAVQATECGSTKVVKAATVKTTANGAYTTPVTPTLGTSYQATFKNAKSNAAAVTVRPLLLLTRVARGSFTAKVTAGQALTGKAVLFQRYAKARRRWVQVKRVVLGVAAPGPAKPAMVTSASFKAKVALRARVRLLISTAQAGPCYVTATSNVVRA
ncbi:MAG: hypothetical protein M3R26_05130 [Actinomycetota bacterium]|nr:hypothetical protein [Actinomycetota bacterium]